jgi:thiol-disulfide isomerase/thioredoxin
LQPGKPALIAFAALWCKPCREEIPSLNQANIDFGAKLQVAEFLVEGQLEGSLPVEGDRSAFTSKSGDRPNYSIDIDPRWEKFDSLNPPKRALPLMVFVDGAGNVRAMAQRSMDYESELKPWIQASLAGMPAPIEPTPVPGAELRTVTFAQWLAETPDHAPGTEMDRNFRAAWAKGIEKYSFDPTEMAFEDGSISERRLDPSLPFDTTGGTWHSETCVLSVYVKPNGEYVNSNGVCH